MTRHRDSTSPADEPDRQQQVTLELLRRYDRPGPRYTSYPTAVEFHDGYGQEQYLQRLAEADRRADEPISLYVHIPFCEQRCHYCGCHVVITRKREVAEKYLGYLELEIDRLAEQLPHRRAVSQYHWGGGTPTYLSPAQMERLHERISRYFVLEPDAEVAIEIDPRVTDQEQIGTLRRLGFNRMSLGVQDFDPDVQQIIGRHQTFEQTLRLYEQCRGVGFKSINFDLIYGLPGQTVDGFLRTLQRVAELRPDRIAAYSYAHVPWLKAHQKKMDPELTPSADLKLELFCVAREELLRAGYAPIGMDHFALPDDELALAMARRRLHRNFMGYTVKMGSDMLGLGISAIGDLSGSFAQNAKKLSTYYDRIDQGGLPIERGYILSDDDRIRRRVISELMCNLHLDGGAIEQRFGIGFDDYFQRELTELQAADGPVEHGFLTIRGKALEVTERGRLFIRNICMVFDRYLADRSRPGSPMFSRTV